jgi:hypothetical protein
MFFSGAHTSKDVAETLEITKLAFAEVAKQFPAGTPLPRKAPQHKL